MDNVKIKKSTSDKKMSQDNRKKGKRSARKKGKGGKSGGKGGKKMKIVDPAIIEARISEFRTKGKSLHIIGASADAVPDFSSARVIVLSKPGMDGHISKNGQRNARNPELYAGDTHRDDAYKSYFGFLVEELPASLKSAYFCVDLKRIEGNPESLGNFVLDSVNFGPALEPEDFQETAVNMKIIDLPAMKDPGSYCFDITEALGAVLRKGQPWFLDGSNMWFQLRISFGDEADGNGKSDRYIFSAAEAEKPACILYFPE